MKFAIWNLWKGSGGLKFQEEFKALVAASDLALTQEALLTHEMITCSAIAGYQAVHGATYRRMDGCRDGVMTLCSAELAKAPERVISGTAEPFLKTTKASLLTYYRYGSAVHETLAVANLHSTLMRRPSTAGLEIRRVIERLEEHDGPVIFAGDFNTFSKVYLREIIRALKILNIEHVEILLDPRTRIGKLDQVFVRGIKINQILVDVSFKQSDHFPILCDAHIVL
jgi:endonuclease/exonuclease/phosphatase (EEP) superfamily protein YafD